VNAAAPPSPAILIETEFIGQVSALASALDHMYVCLCLCAGWRLCCDFLTLKICALLLTRHVHKVLA